MIKKLVKSLYYIQKVKKAASDDALEHLGVGLLL